ncbi:hypothetical protein CRENBAI_023356 [Crenichthys baileyi]|uniref:Uncharacterized protein n=1 Tax=Crenichthys baileyi TaxID=28760 RepID=A0AAV9S9D7_9TELE
MSCSLTLCKRCCSSKPPDVAQNLPYLLRLPSNMFMLLVLYAASSLICEFKLFQPHHNSLRHRFFCSSRCGNKHLCDCLCKEVSLYKVQTLQQPYSTQMSLFMLPLSNGTY